MRALTFVIGFVISTISFWLLFDAFSQPGFNFTDAALAGIGIGFGTITMYGAVQ